MTRCVIGVALGLFAMMGTSPAFAQKKGGKEGEALKNGWTFSLSQGKAMAEKSGKPLMVVMRCVP